MKNILTSFIAVAILTGLLLPAISCTEAVSETSTPTPASSLAPTPTPTPTITPTPTPKPTPKPSLTPISIPISALPSPSPVFVYYLQVGQWFKSSSSTISISSFERTKSYNAPGLVLAPPGVSFIFVSVTMLNSSQLPISVQAADFSLFDNIGIYYAPQNLPVHFYGAFPFYSKLLQPGNMVSGKILFEVIDASSGLKIRTDMDGNAVAWNLPY